MPSLLEITGLSIWFRSRGAERLVVSDLSFSLNAGEVMGLVGESGSGKSVTALAVLRLLDHSARVTGSIRWDGHDLLSLPREQMRQIRGGDIAMIFQEPMTALNPVMSIGEQVAEALRTHQPTLSRKEVRQKVIASLEAVAIPDPEHRYADYPHQFSGGQRQRVLIAMAIVNRPRLLIADEPTTALDVTVQAQILTLLADLRQRFSLSMLFISHDLAVVSQFVDRVMVMRLGMVLENGPTRLVLRNPLHSYTLNLLGAVPTMLTDKDLPLPTFERPSENAESILVESVPGHWVRMKQPGVVD